MASGSHSGRSGVLGNIRFWDIRSGNVVWELKERIDCFADVAVSYTFSSIFKIGVNTGKVFFADLRNMGADNSWVCLGDGRNVSNGKKEGFGCKVRSHGNQVSPLVSRRIREGVSPLSGRPSSSILGGGVGRGGG
ncbi:BTB/POZ domain-containing protein [Abeliophyllum distichum]|uniref:BTB/POZ domain-containing protein n=1 Tax=Abeliophyllum distichum TaxID=126358 RepID=A0ABD1NU86_9LAMI